MFKINLNIGGEVKTFKKDFISIATMESIFDVIENMEKVTRYRETFNLLVEFTLKLFNGEFTEDELKNGIDATEFVTLCFEFIDKVTNGFGKK